MPWSKFTFTLQWFFNTPIKYFNFFFIFRRIRVYGNYLIVNQITTKDAGRYYCSANNAHGNVTKVAEVFVKGDEILDNHNSDNVQEVTEGEAITLYCTPSVEDNPKIRVNVCYYISFNQQFNIFKYPSKNSLIGNVKMVKFQVLHHIKTLVI